MNVAELIEQLQKYPPENEVRIVDRERGFDDAIYMVECDVYGLWPEEQVGICIN